MTIRSTGHKLLLAAMLAAFSLGCGDSVEPELAPYWLGRWEATALMFQGQDLWPQLLPDLQEFYVELKPDRVCDAGQVWTDVEEEAKPDGCNYVEPEDFPGTGYLDFHDGIINRMEFVESRTFHLIVGQRGFYWVFRLQ